jgi:hypothetical protein
MQKKHITFTKKRGNVGQQEMEGDTEEETEVCLNSGARFLGKWQVQDHPGSKVRWARIQDLVEEYRGERWWYKFWLMLVSALTAIFIKCIPDATGNTIAILVLKIVDIIVMGCFAPHNDKWAYWQDMWVAFVNLGQAPLVLFAWRDAGSQLLEQMQQFGSPSSVFQKLKILMGRGASCHSEQIDPRLDPGDVELSTLNRPPHNNQSPIPYVGANRLPLPLLEAQFSSKCPPSNTAPGIMFMAQRFPCQDVRANRKTVFNIPLNEARVSSIFPPVNLQYPSE